MIFFVSYWVRPAEQQCLPCGWNWKSLLPRSAAAVCKGVHVLCRAKGSQRHFPCTQNYGRSCCLGLICCPGRKRSWSPFPEHSSHYTCFIICSYWPALLNLALARSIFWACALWQREVNILLYWASAFGTPGLESLCSWLIMQAGWMHDNSVPRTDGK